MMFGKKYTPLKRKHKKIREKKEQKKILAKIYNFT